MNLTIKQMNIEGKSFLITGGTGSLEVQYVIIFKKNVKEIRIFSEMKINNII